MGCPFGLERDENGCEICACRRPETSVSNLQAYCPVPDRQPGQCAFSTYDIGYYCENQWVKDNCACTCQRYYCRAGDKDPEICASAASYRGVFCHLPWVKENCRSTCANCMPDFNLEFIMPEPRDGGNTQPKWWGSGDEMDIIYGK